MRKITFYILFVSVLFAANSGCKKIQKAIQRLPLADTLRAACTAPFIGHGDSSNIYFPTAFSPNGDGLNDVYRPLILNFSPNYFSSFSLKIYDTTANLVFESNSPSITSWEGTNQGTNTQSTKYKFYIKIKYTTSGNITDSGNTYLYLLSGTTCIRRIAADTARYRFPSQYDITTGFNPTWSSEETFCN